MPLFALFALQFAIPTSTFRIVISVVYLVLAAGIMVARRADIPALVGSARRAYRVADGAAQPADAEVSSDDS